MGVTLARGDSIEQARDKARRAAAAIVAAAEMHWDGDRAPAIGLEGRRQ
jgi:hypothetical protein